MDKISKNNRASKAVGFGLLAATTVSMVPATMVVAPEAAFANPTSAEASVLNGAVTLDGPDSAVAYTDEESGKTWFSEGGKFTITVDAEKYSGVTIEVNGEVLVENEPVTAEENKFTFDLEDDSSIRIVAGTLITEDPNPPEPAPEPPAPSDGGGEQPEPPAPSDGGGEQPDPEPEPEPEPFDPILEDTDTTNLEVGIDSDAPESAGRFEGPLEQVGGDTYTTKDTKFVVDATDYGVGVDSIDYQIQAEGEWNLLKSVGSGESFTPVKDGAYRVVITDLLGNTVTHSFKDMFGTSSKIDVQDPDEQNSAISATVDGESISDTWLKGRAEQGEDAREPHEVVVTVRPSSGIHLGDSLSVNGQDVMDKAEKGETEAGDTTYTLNLDSLDLEESGKYDFSVSSRYIFGKTTTKAFTVKADYAYPTIDDAVLSGDYVVDDGKIYVNGDAYFNANANDIESGVDTIQVFRGDSEEVTPEITDNSFRFKLEQGTDYWVKVTDKVGNSTSKSLEDLELGGQDVIEDRSNPVITETDGYKPSYTDADGNEWFKEDKALEFSITDDNMKSVEINVNGNIITPEIAEDDKYVVDLAKYGAQDGSRYDIYIKVNDRAFNQSEFNRTVFVDSDAPVDIKASVEGSYKDRDFGVFSQNALIIHAKGDDSHGTGIAGYQLLNSETGEVIQDSKDGNIELTSGAFSLVAYDYLGNKSNPVFLKDLLGTKSNRFFIDATAPTVDVTREDPSHSNWYADDIDYTVNFSDDQALYNGVVKVNGQEITSFTSANIETSRQLSFNTSQATAKEDGSYEVVVTGVDAAGNPVTWNETIRIDREAPEITSFTFTEPGFKEGQSLTKSDEYGYFFQNAVSVSIKVSDKGHSSGVRDVHYVLRNGDGSTHSTGTAIVSGDSARVQIPNNFKGYIDAYAVDNVDHKSETVHPSGVITEGRNWYVNTSDIAINLEDPGHRDHKNQYLYNSDVTANVPIRQGVSGIRSVEWGIGEDTLGTANADIGGGLSGSNFSVVQTDKNLILKINGSLPVTGNVNDMKIWVRVTDRAGYTSEQNTTVSIDKDAPNIDVSYNDTNTTNFYSENRTATIRIQERNFDPKDVELSGKYGSLGTWHQSGDTWTNTITFSEETKYEWGIEYTDMAGNVGKGYQSESFIVDKSAPKLSVDFNNNTAANGNFYKDARTATVEVIDSNFDPALVNYTGDGTLSGWSHTGDRHTATVSFNEDGEYTFSVDAVDKAENKSTTYTEDTFIIDTTTPTLDVEGVSKGVSYKKDVGVKVTSADKHIDVEKSSVSLVGRERGKIELDGQFDETTGSFVVENFPKEEVIDDYYMLTARVVDKAGNIEEKNINFSVNRFGSNFNFLNGEFNGEYFQELPDDVIMAQDSVDRLAASEFSVTVLKNGSTMEVPADKWSVTESGGQDSRWKYSVRVDKSLFGDDAKYQVQTFSKAQDGTAESSMDQEYAFVIDDTDPEIYISGVESGKAYTTLERNVTVEVRDLAGVADISILLNGEAIGYAEEDGVYRVSLPVSSKNQDLKVQVTDRAGNVSTEEVTDFYLTSSRFNATVHNLWFRIGLGLLALLVLVGGILLGRRSQKQRQEDREMEAARKRAIAASTSGGVAATTGGSATADEAPLVGEEPEYDVEGDARGAGVDSSQDDISTEMADEDSDGTTHFGEDDDSTGNFDGGR